MSASTRSLISGMFTHHLHNCSAVPEEGYNCVLERRLTSTWIYGRPHLQLPHLARSARAPLRQWIFYNIHVLHVSHTPICIQTTTHRITKSTPMFSRLGQLARHLSRPLPNYLHNSALTARPTSLTSSTSSIRMSPDQSKRMINTAACLIIGDEVLGGKVRSFHLPSYHQKRILPVPLRRPACVYSAGEHGLRGTGTHRPLTPTRLGSRNTASPSASPSNASRSSPTMRPRSSRPLAA